MSSQFFATIAFFVEASNPHETTLPSWCTPVSMKPRFWRENWISQKEWNEGERQDQHFIAGRDKPSIKNNTKLAGEIIKLSSQICGLPQKASKAARTFFGKTCACACVCESYQRKRKRKRHCRLRRINYDGCLIHEISQNFGFVLWWFFLTCVINILQGCSGDGLLIEKYGNR